MLTRSLISPEEEGDVKQQLHAAIVFMRLTTIPEAPGWPFSNVVRFASLSSVTGKALYALVIAFKDLHGEHYAVQGETTCDRYFLRLPDPRDNPDLKKETQAPEGMYWGIMPKEKIFSVLCTSKITRLPSTLFKLPNVALLNSCGDLISWAYIGIDGYEPLALPINGDTNSRDRPFPT
jgi:hypothetical protein